MVEKQKVPVLKGANPVERVGLARTLTFLGAVIFTMSPLVGQAQYQDLNAAPIQSTSYDGSVSARERQLQQVRRDAQALQSEAASVSMARSAGRSIDQQNQDRAVQQARELKAIKRNAIERMKWDRANAQVQAVSSNDMNSWNSGSGGNRIERDVPDTFIASLIEEEESARRRGTLKKEKKRFSPRDLNPFRKDEPAPVSSNPVIVQQASPQFSEPLPEKKGLFSKVKIPGLGGREEEPAGPALPEAPVFRNANGSSNSQSVGNDSPSPAARTVPQRSGAALVDGGAAPAVPAVADESNNTPGPTLTAFNPASESEKEKNGLFSAFKKSENEVQSQVPEKSNSGGLFAFGKKKPATDARSIDASLFPTGAAEQAPTGGGLSGGYTTEDVSNEMAAAHSNTGSLALPGEAPEKKKFSLPKPNLSLPSLASNSKPSERGSSVPTRTTINSQGNDYYVVTSTAQFMVFGEEQMQSEVRALAAGNVVQMTKAGDQWASIRLSNGMEGVVQNKFLRAASSSEAGGQFASTN